ncbi:VanW family protein [Armatimonas sp.]|uniref:VanW family protein n=1 Tax=Armatimonas sp. TaxID=1872638 RepID=UPI00286C5CFA|nr:VanW family protein [Armatimonas sp.]
MTSSETSNEFSEFTAEPPRRSRGFVLGLSTALVALGAVGVGSVVSYSRTLPSTDSIAPGVRIGNADVSGLSREVAQEKARGWAKEHLAKAVVLTAPKSEKKWAITLGELGGRFDLEPAVNAAWQLGKEDNFFERLYHGKRERNVTLNPEFKLDPAKLDTYLGRVAKAVRKPAQNARAKMESGGGLSLAKKEEKGIELDVEATKAALLNGGMGSLIGGKTVTISVKEELPKVTAEDLGKMGTLLGSYTTDYGGSPRARKTNVGLATSKINGTLLAPGEVFSYNDIVGPRESEFGWKMAHQYQDGLVVDGYGGGVCQTSTTLYNAAIRADLKIVKRSNHSMPVRYVSVGCDAAVAYGAVDFKFQNSTDGPIFIGGKANGDSLTYRIYGTKPSERKVLSFYAGSRRYNSSGGSSVTSYRRVQLPDGKVKVEVIDYSSYRAPRAAPSSR